MVERVLVVGVTGFVGGRLSESLTSQGYNVFGASRDLSRPIPTGLIDNIRYDLRDFDQVEKLLKVCDTVLFCAGSNAETCSADPVQAINDNSFAVFEFAKRASAAGVRRFFYFSTAHVYNSRLSGRIREDTPTVNNHPYAISRRTAESLLAYLDSIADMECTVLRLSNAYGRPHSINVNCWNLFVNNICKSAVQSEEILIKSPLGTCRDFIPMNLVCDIIRDLLNTKKTFPVLNVGSTRNENLGSMSAQVKQLYEDIYPNQKLMISYKTHTEFETQEIDYGSNYLTRVGDEKLSKYVMDELRNLLGFCGVFKNVL